MVTASWRTTRRPQCAANAPSPCGTASLPTPPACGPSWPQQHDGKDRWYLEALGIGADKNWDAYLDAYLKKTGAQEGARDIIWRSRAKKTPELLARIIGDKATPAADLPRYFRAFDFQANPEKEAALTRLALAEHDGEPARQGLIALESLRRLKSVDVSKNADMAAALDRVLQKTRGTATYVELVGQFNLKERFPDLLALAQKEPDGQTGVNALRVLLERGQGALIEKALRGREVVAGDRAGAGDGGGRPRRGAAPGHGAGRQEGRRPAPPGDPRWPLQEGGRHLIELGRGKKLGEDLRQTAGAALSTTAFSDIRGQAEKLFPLPAAKDNKPLPPFSQLVKCEATSTGARRSSRRSGPARTATSSTASARKWGPTCQRWARS